MRSWFRPATAIGSNWIDPSFPMTSSTPSSLPARDRAGVRECRATRKRRAASAVTFTSRTLAARTLRLGTFCEQNSDWSSPQCLAGSLRDLVLVCGERSQNLLLFPLGDLEGVESSRELSRDFVELGGRDPEFAVGFFQAQQSAAW